MSYFFSAQVRAAIQDLISPTHETFEGVLWKKRLSYVKKVFGFPET
jgi:hypothetical protein